MLFLIAIEMLFEKRTERRQGHAEGGDDPAVFPIAVPLVAGPGAMATMVLLASQQGGSWHWLLAIHVILFAVLALTLALFLIAARIDRLFGRNGNQRADPAFRHPAGRAGGADRARRAGRVRADAGLTVG